ncbi:hypothetical protein B0H14DRAFT_3876821 [Mycena olivaceomarginata]|nr:hypothetical protein B0H14DRAFT_3876821 [Mycena olivaceomarginata]
MFSKQSIAVASVLITLAAAIPTGTPPPPVTPPTSPQCCASTVPSSSTAASAVAALLGLDLTGLDVLVGLSCSPSPSSEITVEAPPSLAMRLRMSGNKPPDAIYFSPPHAVTSFTKITLDVFYFNKIPKDDMAGWEHFFIGFKPTSFSNLREMEVKFCVLPTSEREIEKSCWVRWAEMLLKRNINLTDKNGVKWRPRLKVK